MYAPPCRPRPPSGSYKQLLASGLDLTSLLPSDTAGAEAEAEGEPSPKAKGSEVAVAERGGFGGVSSLSSGAAPLMEKEERVTGRVAGKTWRRYFQTAGVALMTVPALLGVCSQLSKVATSAWLAWWCSVDGAISADLPGFVMGYVGWLVATVCFSVCRDCAFAFAELRAASTIHNDMLATVMHAPMAFFDTTPLGRIIARFSKDQNTLDMKLPESMNTLFYCLLDVGSTLALVASVSPIFALGLGPIAAVYYMLQAYHHHHCHHY